jgi:hypothetical protein
MQQCPSRPVLQLQHRCLEHWHVHWGLEGLGEGLEQVRSESPGDISWGQTRQCWALGPRRVNGAPTRSLNVSLSRCTLNVSLSRCTLNVSLSTFRSQRFTLNVSLSTFRSQRFTLNVSLSTFHSQRFALNVSPSTFRSQRFTLNVTLALGTHGAWGSRVRHAG